MSSCCCVVPTSLGKNTETFLKWLELTQGRDKLYRLVAYSTKWIVPLLMLQGVDKDVTDRLNKGASAIGLTRKLIRFFRGVEYVNEGLKSLAIKDDVERYLSIAKNSFLCVWMICDHIQWLNKVGYLKLGETKKIDELHSKAWLFGLMAGLVIAAYKFNLAVAELKNAESAAQQAGQPIDSKKKQDIAIKRQKATMAIVKNSVDSVIPAQRLQWLPISDLWAGVAGTITSIIGIQDTWPASKN